MYSRILVTGGAGFIGSHLAIALTAQSRARVTALDNLKRRGSELNLPRLKEAGVDFLHGDVRCPADLAEAGTPDLVVECSAEASAQAGYGGSPDYVIDSNLRGSIHCLEFCRKTRADLLFLSTSRVYPYGLLNSLAIDEDQTRFRLASHQNLPGVSPCGISEDFPLDGPRTIYGATKYASELLISEYAAAYGLRAVINRCGTITGPWQMAKSDQGVFALWMAAHVFDRPLSYVGFGGTGKQVRDFLHVDDLADLVTTELRAMDRYAGGIYNVGGGPELSLSLLECTALCAEIAGRRIEIGCEPETRPGDVKVFLTDSRKIREMSGWQPQRDTRRTFEEIHGWMRGAGAAAFA